MQARGWLVAAVVLLGLASDGSAQVFVSQSSGLGFSYHGRRLRVAGFFSGGSSYAMGYPYGWGYSPFGPTVPYGIIENRVTIQTITPTVILAPRGLAPIQSYDLSGVDLDLGPAPWLEKKAPVIAKAPGKKPLPEPDPEIIVKPTKPFKKFPDLPEPKDDPFAENQRLTALGLGSFRLGDFGWAAKWWGQAIAVDPTQPRPYFLLGQANYAMGRYKHAVAAIENGLRRQPEWPNLAFNIKKDLYEGQEDEWLLQRKWLEDARAKNPKDPTLTFLLAYQFWFDGDKKEAARLFRQARLTTAEPALIDLFLRALPEPAELKI